MESDVTRQHRLRQFALHQRVPVDVAAKEQLDAAGGVANERPDDVIGAVGDEEGVDPFVSVLATLRRHSGHDFDGSEISLNC